MTAPQMEVYEAELDSDRKGKFSGQRVLNEQHDSCRNQKLSDERVRCYHMHDFILQSDFVLFSNGEKQTYPQAEVYHS